MIKKKYTKTADRCRVTFQYPNEENAATVALAGEFNDWNINASPMEKRKSGYFSTTIMLKAGHSYRFRYIVDGERWVNDCDADGYVYNCHGDQDCVVII